MFVFLIYIAGPNLFLWAVCFNGGDIGVAETTIVDNQVKSRHHVLNLGISCCIVVYVPKFSTLF
jgi:hypothetical protein